ncbi:MAG: nicotinate-nucleotide adenylyltransferase [Beijerinckiaceae bacterium]
MRAAKKNPARVKKNPVPKLPVHGRTQRIGLLGGSFNPAHNAHRLVSLTALKRLKLDWVWWLVTPGNPLKDNAGLPPLDARMAAARALAHHPRIRISGVERDFGTHYTRDSLMALRRRAPAARFVWLMGADNLTQFARWGGWRAIASMAPLCVVDRPRSTLKALSSRAALTLARYRLPERASAALPSRRPPAWVFLHGKRSTLSSTAIRQGLARP